ncbi:hypothetical protein A1O3_01959 [Capronia epimyces CBS 606.96]|uniref:BolA protein n=1 Tax=Capronia epimyces CBS 606.96 TaxID=1182542 RepID=W9YGX5_9EURO|nr:uncharacterized protein A1O3_01959 [Capronia epimyces CBS 606.96]EXJ88895.1 hypothetical protein A1O3_01959 [Capronia epimyces CBS 606.96]
MPARVAKASLQAVRRAATVPVPVAVRAPISSSSVFAAADHPLNHLDHFSRNRAFALLGFRQSRPFSAASPIRAAASASASAPMAADAASSGVTADSLSHKLRETLHATHVEIEDMSGGCGQAFNAIIVSPDFNSKTLLARHRLVNNALRAEIAAIHAWTPKCLTPDQWEKEKDKMQL